MARILLLCVCMHAMHRCCVSTHVHHTPPLHSSVFQATVREGAAWYCERNFERVNASCEDMCDDEWMRMQGGDGRVA